MKINGVRVGLVQLLSQTQDVFEREFPGLETGVALVPGKPLNEYTEHWFSTARLQVPVYEKLVEEEEKRLGMNGIEKKPVGYLLVQGLMLIRQMQVLLCSSVLGHYDSV
jgi:hypothetical protein